MSWLPAPGELPESLKARSISANFATNMEAGGSKTGVCVVGASNMDLITYVDQMPGPGETRKGSSFAKGFGGLYVLSPGKIFCCTKTIFCFDLRCVTGKGANQVKSARLWLDMLTVMKTQAVACARIKLRTT